ncbi:MAG: hypothetical protein ABIT07_03795 [Ferruginibacter sp.]
MKSIRILTSLFAALSLFSCDTIRQATNSTGSAFTLTGQWMLASNTPENVLTGSKVTVAPIVAEGRITTLVGSGNCLRENDVTWKNINADNAGGFTLNNLVSSCSGFNYQPATIYVVNNSEIRIAGKNANGQDMTQLWKRTK